MSEIKYSVLMSVYYKENPIYLRESVESMVNQSIKPDEIIIVKDGILTEELDSTLEVLKEMYNIIKLINIPKNVGLGVALRTGLQFCRNEYIARMDTDDICMINRCEKQLDYLRQNPDISLVGSSVAEFIQNPYEITSYKIVPQENEQIKKMMKYKNPINHPTVMFRKSDVINVGNYEDFLYCEDYFLWVKMCLNGMKFYNINECLVKMRVSDDTYYRRGGKVLFYSQKKLFKYMYKNKMINLFHYNYNLFIRFIVQIIIPNKLRIKLYKTLLRKESK